MMKTCVKMRIQPYVTWTPKRNLTSEKINFLLISDSNRNKFFVSELSSNKKTIFLHYVLFNCPGHILNVVLLVRVLIETSEKLCFVL